MNQSILLFDLGLDLTKKFGLFLKRIYIIKRHWLGKIVILSISIDVKIEEFLVALQLVILLMIIQQSKNMWILGT